MKNLMMRMITCRKALSLMLLVLAAFSIPHMAIATHQQNQDKAWTNMGGLAWLMTVIWV
jgi:hypothetical protein